MPINYNYSEPERLFTSARLSSYKSAINTKNNAELFGAYNWNLAVIGAFYPLIQLIEVSLRNTLSNAAIASISTTGNNHWFDDIPHRLDQVTNGPAEQVTKFKEKMASAKRSAKRALRDKGLATAEPTHDQIIASTDFVTWEYLLDGHFYNGSDNTFLWPAGFTKAFKRLPISTQKKKKMNDQRDKIRRRIELVRGFRNRISHNEPSWRVGNTISPQGVIDDLTLVLNNMMELLEWISPMFKRYTQDVGLEARIRQLLHKSTLNRYMHSMEEYDINDLSDLSELLKSANDENTKCYFDVNGEKGILLPNNTLLAQ